MGGHELNVFPGIAPDHATRSRAVRRIVLILAAILPVSVLAGELDIEKAASFAQAEYFSAFKGTRKLDRDRAIDYVVQIKVSAPAYGLDEERYFAQVDWESAFVNNIKDRDLSMRCWSYGLSGIQLGTAAFYAKGVSGRQLVIDYNLNLILGARHMRHLIDKARGDTRSAEVAYNAGWNGMLQGRGATYPGS